eukprot:5987935-Alexandrium_andersonii.AAC.1
MPCKSPAAAAVAGATRGMSLRLNHAHSRNAHCHLEQAHALNQSACETHHNAAWASACAWPSSM